MGENVEIAGFLEDVDGSFLEYLGDRQGYWKVIDLLMINQYIGG
jgi:hypothetical protein